jgi:hypothetical protein
VIARPPRPIAVPPAFLPRVRPGRRHRGRAASSRPIPASAGLLARLADDRQAIGVKLALLLGCLLLAAWLEVPM